MAAILEVLFQADALEFRGYRYPPASVYPSGLVPYASIKEVLVDATPPEVRTTAGEVLFVPAARRELLLSVARERDIPIVSREDVWGLILEPFLDTTFDRHHHAETMARLEANGIDHDSCEQIRSRIAPAMHAYNIGSGLWDWTHLGLADLLDALHGEFTGARHRMQDEEFAAFYQEAMAIAGRARLREHGEVV